MLSFKTLTFISAEISKSSALITLKRLVMNMFTSCFQSTFSYDFSSVGNISKPFDAEREPKPAMSLLMLLFIICKESTLEEISAYFFICSSLIFEHSILKFLNVKLFPSSAMNDLITVVSL